MVLYLLPNKLCETSLLPASNLSSAVSVCHGRCCHSAFPADVTPPPHFWSQLPSPSAVLCPATVVAIHLAALPKSGYFSAHNRQQRNPLHCLFLPMVESHFCMRSQWWSHWVRGCFSWRCRASFSCSHGRSTSPPSESFRTQVGLSANCTPTSTLNKSELLHLHLEEIDFLHVCTVLSLMRISSGITMY